MRRFLTFLRWPIRIPQQNNILLAPPLQKDGKLWRGVAVTDNTSMLLPGIHRERWAILHLTHGARVPAFHPETDAYLVDRSLSAASPQPQLFLTARDLTDPALFHPLNTSKRYDIIFNACWINHKRPELLIRALRYAKTQGRPISCLWFGYQWEWYGPKLEKKIRRTAERYGLNIDFLPVDYDPAEVNRRYNSARIALLCSLSEGGPRVMSEAMLAGLPYIATKDTLGGSTHFINDRNGKLCDATPHALARAIWDTLDHLPQYHPREWALENMCLPIAVKKIRGLLDQLANEKQWLINSEAVSFTSIDWHAQRQEVQKADQLQP